MSLSDSGPRWDWDGVDTENLNIPELYEREVAMAQESTPTQQQKFIDPSRQGAEAGHARTLSIDALVDTGNLGGLDNDNDSGNEANIDNA